jgi:hypothetical protein
MHSICKAIWKNLGVALTFKNTEVNTEVKKPIFMMESEHSRDELQEKLCLRKNKHFRKHYLKPALTGRLMEMTLPPNQARQTN